MTDSRSYRPAGYCPFCDYSMDAGRCPECGHIVDAAQLRSSPRRFQRLRFLPVLLLLGLIAWPIVKNLYHRPLRLAPASTLFARADAAADRELWKRLMHGSLSHKDMRRFSRRAFLAKPAYTARISHAAGAPIQLHTQINPWVGDDDCWLTPGEARCTVDGREVDCAVENEAFMGLYGIRYSLPPLGEGTHTVKVSQQLAWGDSGEVSGGVYSWRERCSQQIVVRGALKDHAVAAYSPALAEQMRDSLIATFRYTGSPPGGYGPGGPNAVDPWVVIDVEKPPVALAGKLDIRYGDGPWRPLHKSRLFAEAVTRWSAGAGEAEVAWLAKDEGYWHSLREIPPVSLRFTPDPQTAYDEGFTSYFGGMIEWNDLHPVEHEKVVEGTGSRPISVSPIKLEDEH